MAGIVTSNKTRKLVGNRLKEIDVPTTTLNTALYYADLTAQGASYTASHVNAELNAYPTVVKNNASLALTPSANKAGVVYAMNGDSKTLEEFEFQRGSSGTYFDASGVMQLAAANVPRINYDAGISKGLLIEPSSSNLFTDSGILNGLNSFPVKSSFGLTAVDTTFELGVLLAKGIKLTRDSTTVYAYKTATILPENTYSFSCYVKKADSSPLTNSDFAFTPDTTISNITIISVGSNVYRVSCVISQSSKTSFGIIKRISDSNIDLIASGFQLEQTTHISSYIPTTTAIATRLADKVLSKRPTAVFPKNSINVKTAEWPRVWLGNGIDNLNIAGRNLLRGTRNVLQNIGTGLNDGSLYQGYAVVKLIGTGAAHEDTYRTLLGSLTRGTTYIVSFYAKASRNMDIRNHFYTPSTTISGQSSTGQTTSSADGSIAVSVTTSWQKYWIKWTQTDTDVLKTLIIGRILNSTDTIELAGFKFEHGTIETSWSPAPEDYVKINGAGSIEISSDEPIHIQQFSLISRELKQEEV